MIYDIGAATLLDSAIRKMESILEDDGSAQIERIEAAKALAQLFSVRINIEPSFSPPCELEPYL